MRLSARISTFLLAAAIPAVGCGGSGDTTDGGAGPGKGGAAGATGAGATAGSTSTGGTSAKGGGAGSSAKGGSAGTNAAGSAGTTAKGGSAGTSTGGSAGASANGGNAGSTSTGGSAGSSSTGGGNAGSTSTGGSAGSSSTGGGNAGSTSTGGTSAGGSSAGGSDAGGSNAGGSNTGGTDAGGSSAGGSNTGGTDAGGSSAGGSSAGGSSAGGSGQGTTCLVDADCDDKNVCTTEVCAGGSCIYSTSSAPECSTTVCGNGVLEGQEQCDDGNKDDTDQCTSACKLFACGDGITQPGNGEQCDDGNAVDGDACTNGCQLPRCGDGVVQASEECDDNNAVDDDACNNSCKKTTCGDGIKQLTEECDDGNAANTDACLDTCKLPTCGDGFAGPGEQCDDGNAVDLDACSNACVSSKCGDGIAQAGEACDDGNADNTDQCTNACKPAACGDSFLQPGESCDDGNTVSSDGCSAACKLESCGDGIKQAGEQCDDQNLVNNDGCTNKCTLPECGDGIVQAGEQCDDGNGSNTDGCLNTCKTATCGDGFTGPGEQCDDGNASNTDACVQGCKIATCGDGFVFAGAEACDDKNKIASDGCTNACAFPGTGGGVFDPTGDGSSGVKLDDNGNIIIDPDTGVSKKTSPLIWVANSGEGTISKIDTKTAIEVARYCTQPGCTGDPSRTTISLGGDAVVANRTGGSMTKIASDKTQCVDRNGNGKIDTWEGIGPVPAAFRWAAGQPFSPDECVLWNTDLKPYNNGSSPYPRAAGFDAEIGNNGELSVFVYVGLYSTGQLLRVESATGKVVKVIKVPGNPYGLVIDREGSVWIQSISALVKVDVKNNDTVTSYPALCMYGIAADSIGRIYTSGYGQQCVRRFDPKTGVSDQIAIGRNGGGVALDQNNDLWTGQPTGVRIKTSAAGPMTIIGTAKNGGHGWAIDYDGNPWSIPINGSQTAYKHDPKSAVPYNNIIAKPGNTTYTYSDMTGFQLINAASKGGVFRKTFQGCGANTKFDQLLFDLTSPAQTTTTVSYRVAADLASLPNAPWIKLAVVPPASNPLAINASGGAIQIELALQSKDLAVTPILSTLEVAMSNCSGGQ